MTAGLNRNADETLPVLKSGDNVYSNVTVTTITGTDLYFTYSGGLGNVAGDQLMERQVAVQSGRRGFGSPG